MLLYYLCGFMSSSQLNLFMIYCRFLWIWRPQRMSVKGKLEDFVGNPGTYNCLGIGSLMADISTYDAKGSFASMMCRDRVVLRLQVSPLWNSCQSSSAQYLSPTIRTRKNCVSLSYYIGIEGSRQKQSLFEESQKSSCPNKNHVLG